MRRARERFTVPERRTLTGLRVLVASCSITSHLVPMCQSGFSSPMHCLSAIARAAATDHRCSRCPRRRRGTRAVSIAASARTRRRGRGGGRKRTAARPARLARDERAPPSRRRARRCDAGTGGAQRSPRHSRPPACARTRGFARPAGTPVTSDLVPRHAYGNLVPLPRPGPRCTPGPSPHSN